MFDTATIRLEVDRWTPFTHEIAVEGVDLTGATFAMQIRDRKDGGFIRANLGTVVDASEGVRLAPVSFGGVSIADGTALDETEPTSVLSIQIAAATAAAMDVATDSGEPGEDGSIYWDMLITPASSNATFVAFAGPVIIKAGVTQP